MIDGAVVLAAEAGEAAVDQLEDGGAVGDIFDGDGEAEVTAEEVEVGVDAGAVAFELVDGVFDTAEAALLPAEDDDLLEEVLLIGVLGLKLGAEAVGIGSKFLGIFATEDGRPGGNAVGDGIAGGDGFALRGAGSGGFLRIGAIGRQTAVRDRFGSGF